MKNGEKWAKVEIVFLKIVSLLFDPQKGATIFTAHNFGFICGLSFATRL